MRASELKRILVMAEELAMNVRRDCSSSLQVAFCYHATHYNNLGALSSTIYHVALEKMFKTTSSPKHIQNPL